MNGPRHAVQTLHEEISTRRDRALEQPAHDVRTAAVLGIALGVCFSLCFVTGLVSHTLQQPPQWFDWGSRPAGLYRITQGVHVISGTAAIPLLLAKLWSVYPRLFLPLERHIVPAIERLSLVPLVGGSLFMLFTGTANIARWYPWPFFFPRGHYWGAWITIGALVIHIGARASNARVALRRDSSITTAATASSDRNPISDGRIRPIGRRTLLGWAGGASLALTAVTAGQTVPFLRRIVLFAPRRPDIGSQGLPVNRAASEAGVMDRAQDPQWRLIVDVDGAEKLSLDLAALAALPQRHATLPIACVEGWSASARWSGVSVIDVLTHASITQFDTVEVVSLEDGGLYSRSILNTSQARDRDTILATTVNGETLNLDHGFPIRLIGPNRPGVMQTKWVTRLVVR
ncbi:MAG: molybdopterin-dependent oxidoreductase [Acidimicrobiales bacterium]